MDFRKCIYVHMRNSRNGDDRNSLDGLNLEIKWSFILKDSKILANIHNKQHKLLNLKFLLIIILLKRF